MHEILVYAGATASFDADNRNRRLASASLDFCAVSRVELTVSQYGGATEDWNCEGSFNYSSDHTSVVADSFPRLVLPNTKSGEIISDHADYRPHSITACELKSHERTAIKSLNEMFSFSRSQFDLHENNTRNTEHILGHKGMISATAARTVVGNKQDMPKRAPSSNNMIRSEHLVIPRAEAFAVYAQPQVVKFRGSSPSISTPKTLLEAVALRAQTALAARNAELQAVRGADQGRTRRTIQVHFQRPVEGDSSSSSIKDTSIRGKTSLEDVCQDFDPYRDRTSIAHALATVPDSVDRFITIATDKNQGSTATPVSEGHTTSDSGTKGLVSANGTLDNSPSDFSMSLRTGVGSASQTFLTKQFESPFYQSTTLPTYRFKAAAPLDATSLMPKSSQPTDFSLCVSKHYRLGIELLHAAIQNEHSIPFDHKPDFLKLFKPTRPFKPSRKIGPTERGYWLLDLSDLGFQVEEATDLWNQFAIVLEREQLYWISIQFTENTFRVYCYVHCMLQVWALLYSLSSRKLLKKSIPWIDAAGHKLAIYP